jgi:hypothetical protein
VNTKGTRERKHNKRRRKNQKSRIGDRKIESIKSEINFDCLAKTPLKVSGILIRSKQ